MLHFSTAIPYGLAELGFEPVHFGSRVLTALAECPLSGCFLHYRFLWDLDF